MEIREIEAFLVLAGAVTDARVAARRQGGVLRLGVWQTPSGAPWPAATSARPDDPASHDP
jgi:hypothetical protein